MDKKEIALSSAKILLDTESVHFNAKQPFTYVSGKKGPVYVDCRRLISFAEPRNKIIGFATDIIKKEAGLDNFDYVAGGETAGIPYAAFISQLLNKPMLYVRKQPKGHGLKSQIEGVFHENMKRRVLLVEDHQTNGGSKKVFVDALKDAGATVSHMFVVFHYNIFPESKANMKSMGVELLNLCDWWDVLEVARKENRFDKETLDSVQSYLDDPVNWTPGKATQATR